MGYWSLITEIISLLLLVVMILNLNFKDRALTPSVRWFRTGLFLVLFSIIWNILCVLLLRQGGRVPYQLNLFMNTIYFILIVMSCSVIAMFVFEKMLEHVYDNYCIRRAKRVLGSLTLAYGAAALFNLKGGFLFWFDKSGGYHRGPFNALGYGVMAIELGLLYFCYFKHRISISKEMKRAMMVFPPVVMMLVILQVTNQGFLLNGIIAAFVELILFLGFHSQKKGYDSVTGLSNRDSFYSELKLRTAGKQKFQVILVTLTDFGMINSRYGYQIGNEFLYSVASWMEEQVKDATVFRYVGVTYAVMLPYTVGEQALAYEGVIQERFKKDWTLGQHSEKLLAVFGDFLCIDEELDANHVMEALDYMLSMMKRSGRQWVRFDDTLSAQLVRRRKVAQLLKNAVDKHMFEVWYQPVYCRKKQCFCSAEALVRMKDEEGGYISPAEFIPIAEELGIVDNIFWLVLEHVCEFLNSGDFPALDSISVNLSMNQLEDPELAERVAGLVKEYHLPQKRIKFEITESQISENQMIVGETVRRMIQCGFQFYLDDFGTGYSNFSSVSKYNFECIKLDKSLVNEVLTDEKSRILIRNLIHMFHDLGVGIIAEGTETKEQVECLVELGVEKIQGYYYARPMSGELLAEFLRA